MIPKSHLISLSLVLTLGSPIRATANNKICYAPDGSAITDPDFAPCIDIVGVESMCCATNRTSNQDTCQPNGLCLNVPSSGFLRDYCTDPTWSSPNCLNKTTCGALAGGSDSSYSAMTQCSDGTWCCGSGSFTTCCDKGLGFKLVDNLVRFNSANGTCTSPSIITVTVTPGGGNGVGTGAIIGVSVGLGVLAVLGSLGGFFTGLRRGKRIGRNTNDILMYGDENTKMPMLGHNGEVHETEGIPVAELSENINGRG